MAPNPRPTFPRVVTNDTWGGVWQALQLASQKRRGKAFAADGTLTPPLTNGDLSALAQEWRLAAGSTAFPWWSQYAAAAYGWNPARPSVFVTSAKQRDALVPVEEARDFWVTTYRLALDLDDTAKPPRFDIDNGAFDDPVWKAQVLADLRADGARIEWKVPLAACRDKDGKVRPARLGCKPGWTLTQISPGAFMCKNDETGELKAPEYVCEGEQVTVDDPITVIKRRGTTALLILVVAWLIVKGDKPASRR